MSTTQTHRRQRKIRRTGRHTTPSQVEKVAEKAGKAAPAVAIAGVLVAGPAANAATATPAKATTTAAQEHTAQTSTAQTSKTTAHRAHAGKSARTVSHVAAYGPASQQYIVRGGDTLASIAQKFYGNYNDWPRIFLANKTVVANANSSNPCERLQIPCTIESAQAGTTAHHSTKPRGKHARHTGSSHAGATAHAGGAIPHGTLGCSGLEQLWVDAGGASGEARMAAEIAMAESGGNQYAYSPTNDRGYWQINGSWGPLSTFDALGNAKAAVHISDDGRNWSPWTTYTSGAYYGRC